MHDFDADGFLGSEIESIRKEIISTYQIFFDYAIKLNRVVLSEKDRFPFAPIRRDVVIATLFCKIITSYQAVVLNLSYGLPNESSVLLRSMMESVFILIANCNDENYYDDYLNSHHYQRLQLLKKTLKDLPAIDPSPAFSNHEIENVNDELHQFEKYNLRIREVAKKAGLEDYYLTNYWILSLDAHVSPRSTEQYIQLHSDTGEHYFDIIPKVTNEQISFIIVLASDLMLKSLVALFTAYSIDVSEQLSNMIVDFNTLHKKL